MSPSERCRPLRTGCPASGSRRCPDQHSARAPGGDFTYRNTEVLAALQKLTGTGLRLQRRRLARVGEPGVQSDAQGVAQGSAALSRRHCIPGRSRNFMSLPPVEAAILADEASSDEERRRLLRAFRQELESLTRAGARSSTGGTERLRDFRAGISALAIAANERPAANETLTNRPFPAVTRQPAIGWCTSWPMAVPLNRIIQADVRARGIRPSGVASFRRQHHRARCLGPLFKEPGFETPPVPACDRPALLESLAVGRGRSAASVLTWLRRGHRPSSAPDRPRPG